MLVPTTICTDTLTHPLRLFSASREAESHYEVVMRIPSRLAEEHGFPLHPYTPPLPDLWVVIYVCMYLCVHVACKMRETG